MLNRKKTRLDIIPASLKITEKIRATFLAALLCAVLIPSSHAQKYRQYDPEIEINTSVLNELSRQMDNGREDNGPPVKLKRPAPKNYGTNSNRQRPSLTGRAMEQNPDGEGYMIMPRTHSSKENTGGGTSSQDATLSPKDDDFRILPETRLDATAKAAIETPPLPPHKNALLQQEQKFAIKAPLPAKKPRAIIQTAKAERLKNIPLPKKRPAVQQASRRFIEQKRQSHDRALADARITDKTAPNPISNARKTMPAAPTGPVITEQLAGERINTHKNKIINAVQQIARTNKEPEIDITAAHHRPRKNKTQTAHDITATSKKPQNIEPAAGNVTPVKITAYSTNKGKVVRLPFPSDESQIDNAIKAAINTNILPSLQSDPMRRIQLQSYASQKQGRSNLNARRVSLSRALSVRQYLVSMGIDAKRIDIRPLGDKTDENQEDRIDFLIFNPNAS